MLATFIACLLVILPNFAITDAVAKNAKHPEPAASQSAALSAQIDEIVRQSMASGAIPGYSLVVIKDGKILHRAGYGFADQEKKIPVTAKTIFGLASITKTFTAMALLSLVENGKLCLDDTLDKHLSDLPAAWRKITIRQLATMTAGIPTGIPVETAWPEEMSIIQRKPLMFAPGTRYCYSNPSYRTLGTVIEKITGTSYLSYVESVILKPLKMTATGEREKLLPTGLVSAPLALNKKTGELVTLRYKPTDISFSSGMLFSSTEDMAKYAQAILDRKLLSATSYNTLLLSRPALASGAAAPWAFGWGSTRKKAYDGKLACGMNGGNPGVSSTIILLPEENLAIVGLSNSYAPRAYTIPRMVARLILGKPTNATRDSAELQELSF